MPQISTLFLWAAAAVAFEFASDEGFAPSAATNVTGASPESFSQSQTKADIFSPAGENANIALPQEPEQSRAIERLSTESLLGGALPTSSPVSPTPIMTLNGNENALDGDFAISSSLVTLSREIGPSRIDVRTRADVDQSSDSTFGDETATSLPNADLSMDYVSMPGLGGSLLQINSQTESDSGYLTTTRTAGSSDAWMAGPYLALHLSPHISVDGRLGFGATEDHIDPMANDQDEFSVFNALSQLDLSGAWSFGNFNFEPASRLQVLGEQQNGFRAADDEFVPAQAMTLVESTIGPKISYDFVGFQGLLVEPAFSVDAAWDYQHALAIVAPDSSEQLSAETELSAEIKTTSGVSLKGSLDYSGIGDEQARDLKAMMAIDLPLPQ